MKFESPRQKLHAIHQNEMCSTIDSIDVNDSVLGCSVAAVLGYSQLKL